MKLVSLTAAAVAALILTATAGAHIIRPGCNSKLAPRAELVCARVNREHALATIGWARSAERKIRVLDATTSLVLGQVVTNHLWLYRVMTARVAEAQHRIQLAEVPVIQHAALWNCIHNGAYPGAPHEGNGYNGQYSGPLQMTSYWGGSPVADWNTVTLGYVYAAAERQYRASGYSTYWLEGQWPQTSPPCLQYAR